MNDLILKVSAPESLCQKNASTWCRQVLDLLQQHHKRCEIDMSQTTQIDSRGIAALLDIARELGGRGGGPPRLVNPSREVIHLLEITRMHRAVEIVRQATHEDDDRRARPILVAEDEFHIRTVAELSLRPLGHPVICVENGAEALKVARSANPAVIVLDCIMPVMDGHAALRELEADPRTRHIPVVLMSAEEKLMRKMTVERPDVAWFVTKPFLPSDLRQKVRGLLLGKPEPAIA